MSHSYKLVGKARSADASFIPSLIGVKVNALSAGPDDLYFTLDDTSLYYPGAVTGIARTSWECYDSLPNGDRDPILAVKGVAFAFYCPASELIALARAEGDTDLLYMLAKLVPQSIRED